MLPNPLQLAVGGKADGVPCDEQRPTRGQPGWIAQGSPVKGINGSAQDTWNFPAILSASSWPSAFLDEFYSILF